MNWEAMTIEHATTIAGWLWNALLIVWVILWFGRKRTKQQESPLERLQHVIPVLLAFWLLFEGTWKALNTRVSGNSQSVLWLGLVLTALGVGISIWARLSLGANWSGMVTLKQGHELIRKGLYRWIRHPIYTGILLGFIGTALIKGHLRGWLGFGVLLLSFYFKARREERFLRQEFGEGFEEHLRHTGMFLPKMT
ncbi:MAG TPA: isoprenylcysteine carboxylmethyltransferase family protein [Candidatus Eisenbacteria bacterium]|nr:isoprenylcysteine carboxylmethyltransferase family protein [Candidatus Eisenbacteria bacterium]